MEDEDGVEVKFYYLGAKHIHAFNRKYAQIQINNPLKCLWFLPLAQQSTMRFQMLDLFGRDYSRIRLVDDKGRLNWSDTGENSFKTESRVIHNAKVSFLMFKNVTTKFNFLIAFVFTRMSDSESICIRPFPWDQAHCTLGLLQRESGLASIEGKKFVFCKQCTPCYGQADLHYLLKSTAIMISASALLHARRTALITVCLFYFCSFKVREI